MDNNILSHLLSTRAQDPSLPLSPLLAREIIRNVDAFNVFAKARFGVASFFWREVRAKGGLRGRPPAPWAPRVLAAIENYEAAGALSQDAQARFEYMVFVGGALTHSLAESCRVSIPEALTVLARPFTEAEFIADLLAGERALKGASDAPAPKAPKAPKAASVQPQPVSTEPSVTAASVVEPMSVADLTAQLTRGLASSGLDVSDEVVARVAVSAATFMGQPLTVALLAKIAYAAVSTGVEADEPAPHVDEPQPVDAPQPVIHWPAAYLPQPSGQAFSEAVAQEVTELPSFAADPLADLLGD